MILFVRPREFPPEVRYFEVPDRLLNHVAPDLLARPVLHALGPRAELMGYGAIRPAHSQVEIEDVFTFLSGEIVKQLDFDNRDLLRELVERWPIVMETFAQEGSHKGLSESIRSTQAVI